MSDKDEEKPLDIAVALNYEKESDNAPKVIAKGYGEVAKRIVETAKENDIIIETNEMLAEALSNVELDETIPIELYEAVAEIIGFVLRANEKIS